MRGVGGSVRVSCYASFFHISFAEGPFRERVGIFRLSNGERKHIYWQNGHQPVSKRKEKKTDSKMCRLEITETELWLFEEKSVIVLKLLQKLLLSCWDSESRDKRYTNVVSATHRPSLHPTGDTPGTHFC